MSLVMYAKQLPLCLPDRHFGMVLWLVRWQLIHDIIISLMLVKQKNLLMEMIGTAIKTSGYCAMVKSYLLKQKPRMSLDCLLYTSDAADDLLCVDLGGRRI